MSRLGSTGNWVSRNRWPVAVAVGLLLLVAYHAIWLSRMRNGFPVDIDEAGYLSVAFGNLDSLKNGGLDGLWTSYSTQAPNAPLVPLLAVPFLYVREGILPAFGIEWVAMAVTGAATWFLARRFMSQPWAALAVLTVMAMPGVLNYTREFSFALPCAAAFTVSVYALVRSRNLSSLPWAIAWGAAAGLAALSRTMALGLLPGLFLAAVWWTALAPREQRARAIVGLLVGSLAGALVAATWYLRNFDAVYDYLTGFGYGSEAAGYGTDYAWLSADRWVQALRTIAQQEFFLPLLLCSAAILLLGAVFLVRALLRPDRKAWLRGKLRSPAVPVFIFVLCGYVALSSTSNMGTAFALPILPSALVLVVLVASRFPIRFLSQAAAVSLVVIAYVQIFSFAQIGGPFETVKTSGIEGIGSVPVTDPRAPAVIALSVDTAMPAELRFDEADRGWIEAGGEIARQANEKAATAGRTPVVGVANRDIVMNRNLLQLSTRLGGQPFFPIAQMTPDLGDTAEAYEAALADPDRGQPNVVMTTPDETGDFEPYVTQAEVVKALRRSGFTPFGEVEMPNGETVTLWWLDRGPAVPSQPTVPVPPAQSSDKQAQPG